VYFGRKLRTFIVDNLSPVIEFDRHFVGVHYKWLEKVFSFKFTVQECGISDVSQIERKCSRQITFHLSISKLKSLPRHALPRQSTSTGVFVCPSNLRAPLRVNSVSYDLDKTDRSQTPYYKQTSVNALRGGGFKCLD
jgi:hypothetical protein